MIYNRSNSFRSENFSEKFLLCISGNIAYMHYVLRIHRVHRDNSERPTTMLCALCDDKFLPLFELPSLVYYSYVHSLSRSHSHLFELFLFRCSWVYIYSQLSQLMNIATWLSLIFICCFFLDKIFLSTI